MKKSSRYHVIGLWRLWLSGATGDAHARAPDALVEKIVGSFDLRPDADAVDEAVSSAERRMRAEGDCAHLEAVSSITVGDLGRTAMIERGDWCEDGSCRHGRGSPTLAALHVYGIRVQSLEAAEGGIWAPARRDQRSFEAVVARVRAASEAARLPDYETYGADVPFFIRPQDERRPRRARPRGRDGGTPG